jgi:hypothetical protein
MFRKHQKKVKSERPALRVDDLRPIPEYRRPRIEDRGPRAEEITACGAASTGWFRLSDVQPDEPEQSIDSPPLQVDNRGQSPWLQAIARLNQSNDWRVGLVSPQGP